MDEEHRHPGFALVAQHLPGQITFSIQILMVVLFAVLSVTSRIEMLTVNVKLLFCNYYLIIFHCSLPEQLVEGEGVGGDAQQKQDAEQNQ